MSPLSARNFTLLTPHPHTITLPDNVGTLTCYSYELEPVFKRCCAGPGAAYVSQPAADFNKTAAAVHVNNNLTEHGATIGICTVQRSVNASTPAIIADCVMGALNQSGNYTTIPAMYALPPGRWWCEANVRSETIAAKATNGAGGTERRKCGAAVLVVVLAAIAVTL
ncbi:uncharacterized protein LOC62_02G001897 [Vanrija pseudolonga]|uniref:Uncharacterized protein n=1 Tax=Vanrija pseudolonga TaxID=143232 RepID=A0AAF0Y5W5_9TREE|nr:hypothetical protein LOC62_02G001897 [Vanrija pseudolonga]